MTEPLIVTSGDREPYLMEFRILNQEELGELTKKDVEKFLEGVRQTIYSQLSEFYKNQL